MDRTSIIVVVICVLLLFAWKPILDKFFPPRLLPAGVTNALNASLNASNQAPSSPVAPASVEAPPTPMLLADTNVPEQLVEITNPNAHYTFASIGGGLKLIELLKYPETVARRRSQSARGVATLDSFTPAPTLALLDGAEVQGDSLYALTQTTNGVRAEKTLTNGLTIVKDFGVSTNYLVTVTVRLENRSDHPLNLPAQHWFAGTATPLNAQDNGSAVGVLWYNGAKSQEIGASYFSSSGFACIPRTPPAEFRGGSNNVEWVAVHNQYFALVVMPHQDAAQVVVRKINLPQPAQEEVVYRTVRQPVGYEAELVYPPLTLASHSTLQRQVTLYTGPKEYRTLATIASSFNNNVDAVMGFGFFGFVSKGLLLWMNWLHSTLALSYGWAIVTITVVIKVVFWPLTQASTRSAKRMQALQPKIKELQAKYKDDPAKQQRKMMEFWKENKINPMSGCLPTLIQMPVFFGFFFMIRTAIELRGAPFLWVADLSEPDTLFFIPGLNFPFNLLPLIMGGTMLWQAHLTPPSAGMDPSQAKIMRYMPLMFMVFLYNYSAGLTLYWTVQNLLSIVQTKLIRMNPDTAPMAAPVLTPPPKKRK
ncbi:MAG TPA: membrane protein insertase YidC [Verrucomicrobiae bacterium]|nr:membrane protein insertase YidC [Verrucomicrobiae bacterium]